VLDAHAAAGGVAVVGRTAFVAEWQTGKLLRVDLDKPNDVRTVLTAIQNPLPIVATGSSLLIGDWSSGAIYRAEL
jgi:hypothetical protein